MFLRFTREFKPLLTVYDCMDELAAFKGAPRLLPALESELLEKADVVFTGGYSLYESKKDRHPNIHPFPSSIDVHHFAKARLPQPDPDDQSNIPHPRLGYFGAIDERMDLKLLAGLAEARPDWHLVLVGPLVKLKEYEVPRAPNIHYLGKKNYEALPAYLAGWDVALLPFARGPATEYISPTKTPEYLAGGKPVVATPIRDVVRTYGELRMLRIAGNLDEFMQEVEATLHETSTQRTKQLQQVDALLRNNAWDHTWKEMKSLMQAEIEASVDDPQIENSKSIAD
jgi:UDP-galactopyranose mutase